MNSRLFGDEVALSRIMPRHSPRWILEGDLKACFDEISHTWMLAHIPTDKTMVRKWLQAGFIDQNTLHPTEAGNPARWGHFTSRGQSDSRWS